MQTATGGLDVIIEMLANVNLEKDLSIAKPDGQIIVSWSNMFDNIYSEPGSP